MARKKILEDLTPAPVMSQVEATGAADGSEPEAEEGTRKQIAKRQWIDDNGKEVDSPEQATGVLYEFLGRTKDGITVPPDGKSFTQLFRDMNDAQRNMLAGFGALTLMGNVTNTWLGEKGDKAETAADAISERFDLIASGQWVDRSAPAGTPKMDLDKLTQAVVTVMPEKASAQAAIRTKLEEDKKFRMKIRQNAQVSVEYSKLMGRTSESLDTLLSDVA